ncbi:MAG: hypothetical protein PHR86_08545 [Desulfobacterales bacterium]|nr:hypothetical protein [Desulfobacterales bacterium]
MNGTFFGLIRSGNASKQRGTVMEDAGAMVAFGGIFLGIYFIIKAVAQFQSMRRAEQAQEVEGPRDTDSAGSSGVEDGSLSKDNRET